MTQATITKSDYLEYRHTGGTTYTPVLLKCPACEKPLTEDTLRSTHIGTHTPEEFGL